MKNSELKTVQEFQDAFGFTTRLPITFLHDVPAEEMKLRRKLIMEEMQETVAALAQDNRVQVADGYADTIYVLAGTYLQAGRLNNAARAPAAIKLVTQAIAAVDTAFNGNDSHAVDMALAQAEIIIKGVAATYEIPMDEVLAEVHRSNMSKVHQDGTVKKNADGKVIKPESYSPADIIAVLSRFAA